MSRHSKPARRGGKLACVLIATLSTGFVRAQSSWASDCAGPCGDALLKSRLDAILADDPAAGRLDSRLTGKPWIAQSWAYAPFAATPSDTTLALRASTHHLGGYANGVTARRYEQAKAMAPGLVMPKPTTGANAGLDVWSSLDVSGERDERKGQLGADYRLTKTALLGVSAGWGESSDAEILAHGESQRIAAYAAFRPAFPVSLDLRAAWGEQEGSVGGEALSGTRSSLSARAFGVWNFDHVKFAPVISVSQEAEASDANAGGAATERSKIGFEPKLSRPFALGGGGTVEPFLIYKGVLGFDHRADAGHADATMSDSIGAGMSLARPETFSMKLTTELARPAEGETNLNGRLELKVPLK